MEAYVAGVSTRKVDTLVAASLSASKVDASPFRSPRGLDGAELCFATERPSKLT